MLRSSLKERNFLTTAAHQQCTVETVCHELYYVQTAQHQYIYHLKLRSIIASLVPEWRLTADVQLVRHLSSNQCDHYCHIR